MSSQSSSDAETEVCWVCLADGKESKLEQPCKCPRLVHRACLSRWQLQSAGKSEERLCRFCKAELPDWREGVTPPGLRPASPVMSIHHDGETFMVKVTPGPDGLKQFQQEVRRLLRLEEDQEFDISFECRVPGTAATEHPSRMELKGMSAFDAAVYCASITAGERLMQTRQHTPHTQCDSPTSPGADPRPMEVDSHSDNSSAASDRDVVGADHVTGSNGSNGGNGNPSLWALDPRMSAARFTEAATRPRQPFQLRSAQSFDPRHLTVTEDVSSPPTITRATRGGSQPATIPLPSSFNPQPTAPTARNVPAVTPLAGAVRGGGAARQGCGPGLGLGPFGRAVGAALAALAGPAEAGPPLRVTRCTSRDAADVASKSNERGQLAPNASFQAVLRRRPLPSPDASAAGSDADDERCTSFTDAAVDACGAPVAPTPDCGTRSVGPTPSGPYSRYGSGAGRAVGRASVRRGAESSYADRILSRARHSASLPPAPPSPPPAGGALKRRTERAASAGAPTPPPSPLLMKRVVSSPSTPPTATTDPVPYGVTMATPTTTATSNSIRNASQRTLVTQVPVSPVGGVETAPSRLTGLSAFATQAAAWMASDLVSSFPVAASGGVDAPGGDLVRGDGGGELNLLKSATSSRSLRSGALLPNSDSVTAALNATELVTWIGGSGIAAPGALQPMAPSPGHAEAPTTHKAAPSTRASQAAATGIPVPLGSSHAPLPRGRRYAPPTGQGSASSLTGVDQRRVKPSMLSSPARSFGPSDL